MPQLRSDNVAEWEPVWFEKADLTPDALFYESARKVVHIDESAIRAVTDLYRELLPVNGVILDLMSSWRSHLPTDVAYQEVVGVGMNADEMSDNPQLTRHIVHSLNDDPHLPFAASEFAGAVCCVSVQYLQRPIQVFQEVRRVLKPERPFVLTFSNRCFPSKAINLWRYTTDEQHTQLVALYFAASGGWRDISTRLCNPTDVHEHGANPLYAVWALAT